MTLPAPRLRLALAVALFVGWLGWLGYLAVTMAGDSVVLSRPQLLVSNLHVVADLDGSADSPADVVMVREASGPYAGKDVRPGLQLTIANLHAVSRSQGWTGPGRYILPLTRGRDGKCTITPTPPSPGYPFQSGEELTRFLRIYPATDAALRQLRQIEGR
jgi:hypothetical protein